MKAKSDEEACSLIDNLVIASPCSVSWEQMTGDNRKRLCGGCSKFVFNISDMSRTEAEEFLNRNGTTECMIFYRRSDGKIMTDDCPVALRRIRDAYRMTRRMAASFFVVLVSIPGAFAQQVQQGKDQTDSRTKPTRNWHMNRFGEMVGPDWKEPVPPPGFYYTGNPAGGGMILRPLTDKQGQVTTKPPRIFPGMPAITSVKPKQAGDCDTPPLVIRQNPNLDRSAQMFYDKGRKAQNEGKKSLSEFFYEKALDAFDNQKSGDQKFRQEIERALKASRN